MGADLKVINLHETKGNPLTLEETSITRGFENFAHPKLVSPCVPLVPPILREGNAEVKPEARTHTFSFALQVRQLTSSNLLVRKKSLLAARELISVPEHRVRCFDAGIIAALVDCLAHEDC